MGLAQGTTPSEVLAAQQAGEAAQGSTAYLNLETGDCHGDESALTALLAAGVSRVVVGLRHPLAHLRSKAITAYQAAGLDVVTLGEAPLAPGIDPAAADVVLNACMVANEGLLHRAVLKRPLSVLKYAMTLDGKIATAAGHSAWVSSPASRGVVFEMRAGSDAVVVGGNTVRRDNPRLTTRRESGHLPVRVVMSRTLDLPEKANLWDTQVVEFDFLTPGAVADYCYERGFLKVFWECGGMLAAPAIASGVIHKVLAFVAPKIIGGARAPTPVGELGNVEMTQRGVLLVAPGVLLVLRNLHILGTVIAWEPGLGCIVHSARSRVQLINVVRANPFCPPSVQWLRQGLESTPVPANYSPPRELYNPQVWGPFVNRMLVWNSTECQQKWLYPQTCQAQGGYTPGLAYTMAGVSDNRLAFDYGDSMGLYEYFNVSFPCTGWVDAECVKQRGYPACFNNQNGNLIWRRNFLEEHWQLVISVATALAAVLVSAGWRHLFHKQQTQPASVPLAAVQPDAGQVVDGVFAGATPPIVSPEAGEGRFVDVVYGRLIGAGSFGRVYEGFWKGRRVAIKVMEVQAAKHLRLVKQELDINMLLQHPNVVRCYDYQVSHQVAHASLSTPASTGSTHVDLGAGPAFSTGGSLPGITEQYVSPGSSDSRDAFLPTALLETGDSCSIAQPASMLVGESNSEYASRDSSKSNHPAAQRPTPTLPSGPVQVSVLRVALDVARGMQHLHQHKICHGDLTSNNVLLCSSSDVPLPLGMVAKVPDFGLSRLLPEQRTHHSTMSCGTVTHAAPEVLRSGQVRLTSDVYSFGTLEGEAAAAGSDAVICRVYQELGTSPWAILSRVVEGMRPVFMAPAVPGLYMELAKRCWDADPEKRPSFDDIVALLEAVVDDDREAGGGGQGAQDAGRGDDFF
eukprot:gene12021-12166_t